jgi:hypothetical protein
MVRTGREKKASYTMSAEPAVRPGLDAGAVHQAKAVQIVGRLSRPGQGRHGIRSMRMKYMENLG